MGSGPRKLVLYSRDYAQHEFSETRSGEAAQMSQSMSTVTPDHMFSPHSVTVGKPYLERSRTLPAIASSEQQFIFG